MKSKIKAFVKRSRFIYNAYFYAGSFLLRLLGLFVRTDPNLMLFVSYGGQKYDDSPRVLYEHLCSRKEYSHLKMVWAFIDPEIFPQVDNKVRIDTLHYYFTALKAGYWITNSSASRGLNFRKHRTVNILFPHGMTALKTIGTDIKDDNPSFRQSYLEKFDLVFIEGRQETDILSKAWNLDRNVFHQTGLPRNDNLLTYSENDISTIKDSFGIPRDKKVILYAPTFREYCCDLFGQITMDLPFTIKKWKQLLGNDYVLLITAHYEIAKLFGNLNSDGFVFNAFKYPEINDLLAVSDILISDYSSVSFDYSILERPIFCFGFDYDRYATERGFYTDPAKLFSHGVISDEDALIHAICNIDYEAECRYTRENIKNPYIYSSGNAAAKAAEIIFDGVAQ